MPHRRARVAVLALAASVASGCTLVTHRCRVPPPVVEAAPGPRLPGAAAVRYEPPAVAPEQAEEAGLLLGPYHRTVVDAGAPTRALFDRLAASMFERTVPAPPADALLDVRLDRFFVAVALHGTFASVAYRATLRSGDGAEIAVFDVDGAASLAPSLRHAGVCGARGEATAVAMQVAGEALVRKISASDAVAAWLAARGAAPVTLAVKPLEAYSTSTAAPRPVDPGPPPVPLPPRSLRLRAGAAAFLPQSTSGKLEGPSTGIAVTAFAAEAGIAPGLRLDVDVDFDTRSYSAAHVPHLTGFGPRATLDGWTAGAGLRYSPPIGDRPPLEPWIGASVRVLYTNLRVTYFGGSSGGETTDSAWSVGADLGGGLNLFPWGPWFLGAEVRWRLARASLAPLGSVGIGGLLVGGSLGAAFP